VIKLTLPGRESVNAAHAERRGGELLRKIERKQGHNAKGGLRLTMRQSQMHPSVGYRWMALWEVPEPEIHALRDSHAHPPGITVVARLEIARTASGARILPRIIPSLADFSLTW
jgi:hypothetical protein